MREAELLISAYLDAADGNAADALRQAVTDLMAIHAAAELRTAALNQWVSRGYLQGRASDVLEIIQQDQRIRQAGEIHATGESHSSA